MSFLGELGKGLLGAVTGGLTGAVGSLFGLGTEALSNEMSKEDQKELMKYQFDLNQKGVENQRNYDKPINQMARLAEANLNPNLVYGSGSVVGNTSSTPSASLGQARKTELSKYDQMAQQLTLAKAQADIKNVEADTRVKESQIPLNQSREYQGWQQGALFSQLYRWNDTTWNVRQSTLNLQNALVGGNLNYITAMYDKVVQETQNSKQITESTLKTMAQAREYQIKQYELDTQKLGELIRHNLKMETIQAQNVKAFLISALAAKMNAGTNAYDAETRRKQYELAKDKFNKFSDYEVGKLYQETLNAIAYRQNYLQYLGPYYEQTISNMIGQDFKTWNQANQMLEFDPVQGVQSILSIPGQIFP